MKLSILISLSLILRSANINAVAAAAKDGVTLPNPDASHSPANEQPSVPAAPLPSITDAGPDAPEPSSRESDAPLRTEASEENATVSAKSTQDAAEGRSIQVEQEDVDAPHKIRKRNENATRRAGRPLLIRIAPNSLG